MTDTAHATTEDSTTDHPEGRDRAYRLAVSDETLAFRPLALADPVPLGRQVLAAAGFAPPDAYSLFAILPGGDFEDVRLDEPFDLRGKEVERLVAFNSDRVYRLTLNDRELRWGHPTIAGSALYALAAPPDGYAVFLDARGGRDRLVEPGEAVRLSGDGAERFVTAPRPAAGFDIFVNTRPKHVPGPAVTYDQVVQLAFPGTHDPNVEFSITYTHAASTPPVGELGRGGSVLIKNGTRFNVTRTVQS